MRHIDSLLDRQLKTRPEGAALVDTLGACWSYGELGEAVDELAEAMSDVGVKSNDRVMILLENCALVVASVFACARLGAAIVPVNARQSNPEVDRVIDHADPVLILFTSAVSDEARGHGERLRAEPMPGSLEQIFNANHWLIRRSGPDAVLDDVATILYTTGTTGTPKGVMLTHNNLCFAGAVSAETRGLRPDDEAYGVLPISHVFGLASVVTACIGVGAKIRLAPRFTPKGLYDALISGVTVLSAVPQMHALLMQYAKEQGYVSLPTETLRYVSSGAAPLDPDWKRRAEAFFGIPVQNGYGMTEASAGICLTAHKDSNPDISVGKPFPGVEIRLDETARGAGDGVGEVQVSGGGVMKGYYRNDLETEKVFCEDGWLRTGDLGRIDAEGNLHIVGRSKELIIHGGFNVYPPEVEAALNDHPKVIQCAVVGHRVEGDEKVYAFVEASPEDWPQIEDIQAFVAKRLAGYKRPSRIILTEHLPAAATGKILKHRLGELLEPKIGDRPQLKTMEYSSRS